MVHPSGNGFVAAVAHWPRVGSAQADGEPRGVAGLPGVHKSEVPLNPALPRLRARVGD